MDGANAPGQGLERWREQARPFFEIRPLGGTDEFVGRARFAGAGRLVLSQVTFSPQRMEHDPARLGGFDHAYLLFERYHEGAGRGLLDGEATRIDPGSMHLVDMSRHYRTMTSSVVAEGVLIPHAAVRYDPSVHPPYASVATASSAGRALAAALQALRDAADRACGEDGASADAAFCEFVRTLLLGGPAADDGGGERGRALLLRAYILRHLDDLELTAERLCLDLGLSRPTLYRLLGTEGGARCYINGLRLDRCFAELLQATAQRGHVRCVAERWGFYDAASFNRRFRQRFGFAPSECLGEAAAPDGNDPHPAAAKRPDLIREWMRLR